MLLSRLQRLPWQLTCLLFASVATASISPSDSSTARPGFIDGTSDMNHAESDGGKIADLLPLTKQATSATEGDLYYTTLANVGNLSDGQFAYISCSKDDYIGYLGAQSLFQQAYGQANISGIILYSTASDYCNYTQGNDQDIVQDFAVYSMTNKQDSKTVLDAIDNLPAHMKYFVKVEGRGDGNPGSSGSGGGSGFQQQNPLGPSPSTAVAMIILYSITGIITALFLVIIITGAVRAHRHPERYGPRNVLGRPRQSRARGLGRAILDTIPIVKFGEKEPVKSTDVELGSTPPGARDVDADGDATVQTAVGTGTTDTIAKTTPSVTATPQDAPRTLGEEHQEGIAPAQPLAAGVATATDTSPNPENLGCSICTEDFEKGQDLRVLPCDHKFHPECVDPWLLNVSGTCPLCRVDLRPITSHDSSQNDDELAPPLINPEAETSHRRRTAFRDILLLRQRPNASAEERIFALRRLREQRRDQSERDVAGGSANASTDDVAGAARDRRSRRISVRLSDVFTGRRRERREESPAAAAQGESSRTAAADPGPEPGSEART